jgi:hypothetical protein
MKTKFAVTLLCGWIYLQAQSAVRGLVLDEESGKGIGGVAVKMELIGQPAYWVEADSDSEGRFALDPSFRGECSIAVEKFGYVDPYATSQGSRRVQVRGESAEIVSISLRRSAAITGTVFDGDGKPLAGAIVGPVTRDPDSGDTTLAEPRATVDDRGHYGLYGLAPGTYAIAAVPSQTVPPRQIFAPIYFPAASQVERASRVHLSAGQTYDTVSFVVPLGTGSSIAGTIAGVPGMRALVVLYRHDGYGGPLASTYGDGGRFAFDGLPLGHYRIVTSATSSSGERWYGRAEVDLEGGDPRNIEIAMEPAKKLAGRLEYAAGEAHSAPCWRNGRVSLTPSDVGSWLPVSQGSADAAGAFALTVARSAPYSFVTAGLAECAVVEVRQGGAVAPAGIVSSEQGPVTVVVTGRTNEVDGKVRSGANAAAGATVILAPVRPSGLVAPEEAISTASGEDGGYRFERVAAGRYYVIAVPPGTVATWRDSAFWSDHRDQAATLTFSAGDRLHADLKTLAIREDWR